MLNELMNPFQVGLHNTYNWNVNVTWRHLSKAGKHSDNHDNSFKINKQFQK